MDSLLNSVAGLRLGGSGALSEADAPRSTITGPSYHYSINNLPPEILMEIFLLCGQVSHRAKWPKHDLLKATLTIGKVCQRWRKISLSCSDMWARCFDLVEHSVPMLKIILQRVKNSGIDFVLPAMPTYTHPRTGHIIYPSTVVWWRYLNIPNLRLCNEILSKSRSLSVSLTTEDGNALQWWPIKLGLSQLVELHLHLANNRECLILDHNDIYNEAESWKLRSLSLDRCFFPLNASFLSYLRELSIVGLDDPNVAPTPESLLDILANLPQLRRLRLCDAMKKTPAVDTDENIDFQHWTGGVSDICLPLLETLDLRSEFSPCSTLLSRLVVPPSCNIYIRVHSLWEMCDSAFGAMTSWIQTRFNKDEPTLGKSLFATMTGGVVAIHNHQAPLFDFCADFCRGYDAEGNIVHGVEFSPDELFQALVGSLVLPSAYITELKLAIDCDFEPTEHQNFYAQAFSSFVAVENLSLLTHDSFCFMVPVCDTGGFVQVYRYELREWASMALFPKLQKLSSRDVNFIDPLADNVNLGKKLLTLVELRKGAHLAGFVSDIKNIDIEKGSTGKQLKRKDRLKLASYGVAVKAR